MDLKSCVCWLPGKSVTKKVLRSHAGSKLRHSPLRGLQVMKLTTGGSLGEVLEGGLQAEGREATSQNSGGVSGVLLDI